MHKKLSLIILLFLPAVAQAKIDLAGELSVGRSQKKDDTSFSVKGVYNYNQYFGVEVSYIDFGNLAETEKGDHGFYYYDVEADSVNLGVKIGNYLHKDLYVVARFGLSLWGGSLGTLYESTLPPVEDRFTDYPTLSDEGKGYYFSFGFRKHLTDNVYVGGELTQYNWDSQKIFYFENYKLNNISLLVGYDF
ncbi:outer membrane beta-barrel protein [Thalassotalea sp. PS06]|uniref:outer membrane beta-barrel protein n=1 Tax=Thalassotalea sp. PS06 TaxID=2594005 RepID=UPI00163D7739|nr:outer membrane beta-barrel protein [Thalassotalea sp. PS06]